MVEATQKAQSGEFSNNRRVIRSLTKYTNAKQVSCLIGSSAMYAHNQMDGQIDIFSAKSLIDAQLKAPLVK